MNTEEASSAALDSALLQLHVDAGAVEVNEGLDSPAREIGGWVEMRIVCKRGCGCVRLHRVSQA